MADSKVDHDRGATLIPARVDSIALGVADVGESVRFYRDVMGFEQLPDKPGEFPVAGVLRRAAEVIVSFQLGNVILVLIDRQLLAEEENVHQLPSPGASTMAVRVSRAQVDLYMERLQAAGVRVLSPATSHGALRIGFVADPDGHVWEVIEDPGPDN